ncbi:helix-turn-helix transcriptional regulator [Planomonospora venezuelensis]|uniref:Putative DNA-binding transcriptional regulator YafY n=1 Tax=Planomonospora venezuelensis TaxID=1999 RepID=A0A841DEP0_PLAVE|nr:YafY family protein [Planomonospora venezuelensis]MBB5965746.1 putative DNA-binding transcriptional regulator YafY [Planomonospora venezuelensis]GIM62313.1 transcriptional regulator [Planomonospora venezuelensis]
MRASRLISLLMLLQTRGRMTAQQLARELEVSVRTVYRDVEALHSAGIPLYGDAGPSGGYRLLDGYRTRLTGLTPEEAESLFLAGMPGPAAELGLGSVVTAARLKLMAALPAELRDRAGRIRERFHLDAPNWYHDADETPYLAAVADAVWNQRRAEVRYRRWKAPQEVVRVLEPYGLVLKAGRWYLVARADEGDGGRAAGGGDDGGRGGVRTYRVSQILGLRVLAETFDRPAGFDLAAHWRAALEEFEARLVQGEAVVRLSPAGMERLPDMARPAMLRAAEATAEPDGRPGWTRITVPTESPSHTLSEFLRFGTDLEVLSPAGLRDLVSETARSLAALYGEAPSAADP